MKQTKVEILTKFFSNEKNLLLTNKEISKLTNIDIPLITNFRSIKGIGQREMKYKHIIKQLLINPKEFDEMSGYSEMSKHFQVTNHRMKTLYDFAYNPTKKQIEQLRKWKLISPMEE